MARAKSVTISNRLHAIAAEKAALEQEEAKLRQELGSSIRNLLGEVADYLDPVSE